ncbi:MAG: acyltransferase [Planctomycetes bacterium]|nr:acyltransferase [Planctomycetota bacterium]
MAESKLSAKEKFLTQTAWMDMMRGMAVAAVIIRHWLHFIPYRSNNSNIQILMELLYLFTGTAVHLFFILSGCGLTLSYLKQPDISWKRWWQRRLTKTIIPYWLVIGITFIMVDLFGFLYPGFVEESYGWYSLAAYLLMRQNFYQPCWTLNLSLWFIPVITGLYIVFPLLIYCLKNTGKFTFFLLTLLISWGAVSISLWFDNPVSRQTAIFPYYLADFTAGAVLGYILLSKHSRLIRLLNGKSLLLGLGIYGFSAVLMKYGAWASYYKGIFVTTGLFLIMLNACWLINRYTPIVADKILGAFSRVSLLMYLVHVPIIVFVIHPLIIKVTETPLTAPVTVLFSLIYSIAILFFSMLITPLINLAARPLNRITSLLLSQAVITDK